MNLEKEKKALQADRDKLQAKTSTVEARITVIPNVVAKIKAELVISEKPDYQANALELAALQLEQETLTEVFVNFKKMMLPIRSRLESIGWAISDREKDAEEKVLREKIKTLKSQGESPKTVKERLGLSQREYERLAA